MLKNFKSTHFLFLDRWLLGIQRFFAKTLEFFGGLDSNMHFWSHFLPHSKINYYLKNLLQSFFENSETFHDFGKIEKILIFREVFEDF